VAYDDELARRVREHFGRRRQVVEKRMFGGLAFMLRGHMCCGVVGDDLMVRVGAGAYDSAVEQPHARPMDFTGKPLRGFVYVGPKGTASAEDLERWIDTAVKFVQSLPAKE